MRIDLLQKRMEAMGLSQRDVVEQARISRSAFNRKMNGVSPFDVDEAMRVLYVLGIVEPEEIVEYMGSYDFKAWINEQISGVIGGERVEEHNRKARDDIGGLIERHFREEGPTVRVAWEHQIQCAIAEGEYLPSNPLDPRREGPQGQDRCFSILRG